jgi:hypothetical protein
MLPAHHNMNARKPASFSADSVLYSTLVAEEAPSERVG